MGDRGGFRGRGRGRGGGASRGGGYVGHAGPDLVEKKGPVLLILEVPERICDTELLRTHFEQAVGAGRVKAVTVRKGKRGKWSALATFAGTKEASEALQVARFVQDGDATVELNMRYYIARDQPAPHDPASKLPHKKTVSFAQTLDPPKAHLGGAPTEFLNRPSPTETTLQRQPDKAEPMSTIPKSPYEKGDRAQRFSPMDTEQLPRNDIDTPEPSTERDIERPVGGEDVSWKLGGKVELDHATEIVGTCMDMCPEAERNSREAQRDLSVFETVPGTGTSGQKADLPLVDHLRAVKKYARSAAASEAVKLEVVRPPPVLKKTMNYLLDEIVDRTDVPFYEVHNFVRDRTRSIRQDFTYQGVRDESCIEIHEKCVRFHILSEHRLCGADPEVFQSKQNMEQLDKCLISLREMYDSRRSEGGAAMPNEAEMQAYFLLTHSENEDVLGATASLPAHVTQSHHIQFAFLILTAIKSKNIVSFAQCLRDAPYLVACLLHKHFLSVRSHAIIVMEKSYTSRDVFPINLIIERFFFEDTDEAIRWLQRFGMRVETKTGASVVRFKSKTFVEAPEEVWRPIRADRIIEMRAKQMRTSQILGGRGKGRIKTASLRIIRKRCEAMGLDASVKDEPEPDDGVTLDTSTLKSKIKKTLAGLVRKTGSKDNPGSPSIPNSENLPTHESLNARPLPSLSIGLHAARPKPIAEEEHPASPTVSIGASAGSHSGRTLSPKSQSPVDVETSEDNRKSAEIAAQRAAENERLRRLALWQQQQQMAEQQARAEARRKRRRSFIESCLLSIGRDLNNFESGSAGPDELTKELEDLTQAIDLDEALSNSETIIEMVESSFPVLDRLLSRLSACFPSSVDPGDIDLYSKKQQICKRLSDLADQMDGLLSEAQTEELKLKDRLRREARLKLAFRYRAVPLSYGKIPKGARKESLKSFNATSAAELPQILPMGEMCVSLMQSQGFNRVKVLVLSSNSSIASERVEHWMGLGRIDPSPCAGSANVWYSVERYDENKLSETDGLSLVTVCVPCHSTTGRPSGTQDLRSKLRQIVQRNKNPISILILAVPSAKATVGEEDSDPLGLLSLEDDQLLNVVAASINVPVRDSTFIGVDVTESVADALEKAVLAIPVQQCTTNSPRSLWDICCNRAHVTLTAVICDMSWLQETWIEEQWREIVSSVNHCFEELAADCSCEARTWGPAFGEPYLNLMKSSSIVRSRVRLPIPEDEAGKPAWSAAKYLEFINAPAQNFHSSDMTVGIFLRRLDAALPVLLAGLLSSANLDLPVRLPMLEATEQGQEALDSVGAGLRRSEHREAIAGGKRRLSHAESRPAKRTEFPEQSHSLMGQLLDELEKEQDKMNQLEIELSELAG